MKSTLGQIVSLLAGINSPQPCGFSAITEPKLAKPAPFAIRKLSRVSAWLGNWERMVNNQLVREGNAPEFVAKPRRWGVHVSLPLVEHKGKYYLSARVQSARAVYLIKRSPQSPWQVVNRETVSPYLAPSIAADTGTEKEFFPRDYSLASLARITIGGRTYAIRHPSP